MEISAFLKKEKNAWLSKTGTGQYGWEEVPYWLKGFMLCGYLLDNPRMNQETQIWIDGILNSRKPDGWFGPDKGRTGAATDLTGREDLWPNMIALFCLQSYYERTNDKRVLELMTGYFKYLHSVPEEKFLAGYWAPMRAGDQLYSIFWLYNHTGDAWLLELAHKTHRRAARWDRDVIDWHNVNMAQGFREPATYAQLSKNPGHLAATERDWTKMRTLYGQVPGGMYGADENARQGYNGPRQAIETCGSAEEMLSDEILLAITGDPAWAERCENVAFNTYPAHYTADYKALRYLTSPNQPQSDHANKAPGVQNGGNMFEMNPHAHRCCQHNAGHAWPYFAENLWYASAGNGLAALLYAPCVVAAKVADGVEARIEEKTRYPFEDKIEFLISLPRAVRFPLSLRIPVWCDGARLQPERPTPGRLLSCGPGGPSQPRMARRRSFDPRSADARPREDLDGQSRFCVRGARPPDLLPADQGGVSPPRRHAGMAGLRHFPCLCVELWPRPHRRRRQGLYREDPLLAGRQPAFPQRDGSGSDHGAGQTHSELDARPTGSGSGSHSKPGAFRRTGREGDAHPDGCGPFADFGVPRYRRRTERSGLAGAEEDRLSADGLALQRVRHGGRPE